MSPPLGRVTAGVGALRSGLRRPALQATATNLGMVALATVSGIVVARGLGPDGRGHWAAILAYFALAQVVAEVGQSGAVTYFVSRHPEQLRQIVVRARWLMLVAGVVLTVAGLVATPLLAGDDPELQWAYALMFIGVLLNSAFASSVYALQAVSIGRWNVVRLAQPLLYSIVITALAAVGMLSLIGVACCLVVSILLQFIVLALVKGAAAEGHASDEPGIGARRLLAYGGAYAGAAVPTSVAGQYDKLVLSRTVPASDLGQYAVGSTVANLVSPFATAIASVMFPRASKLGLADGERARLETTTLVRTAFVSVVVSAGLCLVAPLLVPLLFGRSFSAAVPLVWALALVMVFRSLSQVAGAFVRARNHPGHAAAAQITGLVSGLLAMGPAIGLWGVFGAPVALGLGELVTLTAVALALVTLRRRGTTEGGQHA